jgi:cysteinyl-tRNA synthetase
MEQLSVLKAQIDLQALIQSLKLSIDEVTRKKPESEYITGMSKHLNNMIDLNHVLREMEQEVKRLNQLNFNYHKSCMDLKYENEKLKEQVERLKEGI